MRDRHPDVFLGRLGCSRPAGAGAEAIAEVQRAAAEDKVLGFHFHPIMGHYRVDDPRWHPLFECIAAEGLPVMIDVGMTGMGAGMPGGLGAQISDAHPLAGAPWRPPFPR